MKTSVMQWCLVIGWVVLSLSARAEAIDQKTISQKAIDQKTVDETREPAAESQTKSAKGTAEANARRPGAYAQVVSQSVTAALQSTARRQYPGGLDEEDLTVQPTLPNPIRGNEPNEVLMNGESAASNSSSGESSGGADSPASD